MTMIDNVILLCSEITKGMKSYGPKAFIPVGQKHKQKPLIIKQIDNILQTYKKNTHIYIVTGFEHEKFIKILNQFYPEEKHKNIIKLYNEDYRDSNSGHGVWLALNSILSGNTLVVENGILTDYSPKSQTSSILPMLKASNKDESFNMGLTVNNKKVEYVFYDLPNRWSEVLYINNSDIQRIKEILGKQNIKHKFLFELINLLIDNEIIFETEFISSKNISKVNNHKTKI